MKHVTPITHSRPPRPALRTLWALAALTAACADPEPRELGFTPSTEQASSDEATPFYSPLSDFLGNWVGTAQEPLALTADGKTPTYRFPSGSSRIAMDISSGAIHYLKGHISFGAGDPPPPPTDASVGYPAGVSYDALMGYQVIPLGDAEQPRQYTRSEASNLPPFEGFNYDFDIGGDTTDSTGTSLEAPDGVISFYINTNEPLDPWCKMQTPQLQLADSSFSCVPDTGGSYEVSYDGPIETCTLLGPSHEAPCSPSPNANALGNCSYADPVAQMDCDALAICTNDFCECQSDGCQAGGSDARLRLRREGDELIGVFENMQFKNARGLNISLGEVRLQRGQ